MSRAIAALIGGVGVNLASTFASSLGLSVHQQRVGFAVGSALILLAVLLFARSWWADRHAEPSQPEDGIRSVSEVVAALPDPRIEDRNILRLIQDARAHAADVENARERLFEDRRMGGNRQEQMEAREVSRLIFVQWGLADRSRELYQAGREWGFFQPIEESLFGVTSNMGVLRSSAGRLRDFATFLEGQLHTSPASGSPAVLIEGDGTDDNEVGLLVTDNPNAFEVRDGARRNRVQTILQNVKHQP